MIDPQRPLRSPRAWAPALVPSLGLAAALLCGCPPPPPTFPENTVLHQRAGYASGGGAVAYVGRLSTNDGRLAFFEELDGYVALLQRIMEAQRRMAAYPLAADAPATHVQAVAAERGRLREDAEQVSRLVREFLDLAAGSKLVEVIPELDAALRLAQGPPPAPGLDPMTLRERQRLIGSGPARCGAETADPIAGPHPPPAFWVMARDSVDVEGHEVSYSPEMRARFARVLSASRAQRQAMGHYGVFTEITPRAQGGEVWRFQLGSVARSAGGTRAADWRPRAVVIECEFDARGLLVGGRETVLGPDGKPVRL